MKRRAHLPNIKKIKRNRAGTERAKIEGLWRTKDAKSGTFNHKDRAAR